MAAKREKPAVIATSGIEEPVGNADILGEQDDADIIF
jgi:hypothetical protein